MSDQSSAIPADAPQATNETNPQATDTNGASASNDAHTNGDASLTQTDVEIAGPQGTTEVNAPTGEGTAEADVARTAEAASDATPASKSKRKSSTGVPEHKTKKLGKKKSMITLNLGLEPGEHVWARLKGFPPWPGVICDEAMLPETLLANRPVSAKRPDGSYREDFAEEGKNVKDRNFPVMFLHTNEFAWMINSALTKLDPSECEDTNKKLSPSLKKAYEVATQKHDLEYYKDVLRQFEEESRELDKQFREKEERKAQEAAERAEKKAEKERRKSKTDGDAMDVDGEGKPSKKRKKDAESDGEGAKPKKTPKVKLSAKEPKPDSAKKSKPAKKAAAKEEPEASEATEAERLVKREKNIFYFRHRLQKCFLSSDNPPSADDMPDMSETMRQLEGFKDLEASVIRKTKIHKVLKNIVRLDNIPRDDEFNFKSRSSELLKYWNEALSAGAEGEDASAKPATNGAVKAEETKEPAEAPVEATDPGNTAADEAVDTSMVDASVNETKDNKPAAAEDTKEGAKEASTNGAGEQVEPTTATS